MGTQPGVGGVTVPLPQGGGSVRSIGDGFEPDLHTGTGAYSIPLDLPPGPGKLRPDLSLQYSSGVGNGPFGLGWRLPVISISRQTDRGLPRYDATDRFLCAGEELVELVDGSWRARHEGTFRRTETVGNGWLVRDRGGREYTLGQAADARTEDGARRAAWAIERVADPCGNAIDYTYLKDGGRPYLQSIAWGIYVLDFAYEERPDATVDRRFGFPVETALRCTSISLRLAAEADWFRRTELSYRNCPFSGLSMLGEVRVVGRRDGQTVARPPLQFDYGLFEMGRRYVAFAPDAVSPPPRGLDDPDFEIVDLYASGLPGVVQLSREARRYWPNLGTGRFGPPETLRAVPEPVAFGAAAVAMADMEGTGTADLALLDRRPFGYYRNQAGEGWTSRARFPVAPAFDPQAGGFRFLDLDADGVVDILRTTGNAHYAIRHDRETGWQRPEARLRERDAARFPDVSLDDPRVKLADMTGDGLIDIVELHAGLLAYWPNLGHGQFGPRLLMRFDGASGPGFAPERAFLSDVNGDGVADLVYVDRGSVRVWINRSGVAFAPGTTIRHTPPAEGAAVRIADMRGNGTAGVLWSYALTRRDRRNYKYLDFTPAGRPYLLTRIDNGVGLVTEVDYSPSTEHARASREAGAAWSTTLPFAVPVVSRIRQTDQASGAVQERRITYRDGLFDGARRRFAGFARVETEDLGDADQAGTRTVSHFLNGADESTPGVDATARRALVGRLARLEVYDAAAPAAPLRVEESVFETRDLVAGVDGTRVIFGYLARNIVQVFDGSAQPQTTEVRLSYDDFGNVTRKEERWGDGNGGVTRLDATMAYAANPARWLWNLPATRVERDEAGTLLSFERYFYDGPDFTGLAEGAADKGLLKRHQRMVVTDATLAQLYPSGAPDHAALGHVRIAVPGGEGGWAVETARYAHDAHGNPVVRRSPRGDDTTTTFDADGLYPVSIRNPLGHETVLEYDLYAAQLGRTRDASGHETVHRFDPLSRIAAVVKPGDSDALPTLAVSYDETTVPVSVRTELRKVSGAPGTLPHVEYYDGRGEVLQRRTRGQAGRVVVDGWRRFGARGYEAERTPPFSAADFAFDPADGAAEPRRYRFTHDALGRIVETVTPDGGRSRVDHAAGQVVRHDAADLDASAANQALGYFETPRVERFDAKGRLVSVAEDDGARIATSAYAYDPLGRLVSVTDAEGRLLAAYTYDMAGRRIALDHSDAGQQRVAFDALGKPAILLAADGTITEVDHDAIGRKTEIRAGTGVERFAYDARPGAGPAENLIGRLASVHDAAGRLDYAYDSHGRVAGKTRTATLAGGGTRAMTARYAYDTLDRMTAVTYPDGARVDYVYGEDGRLATVGGVVAALTFDDLGRCTRREFANGVVEEGEFEPTTFLQTVQRITGPARPEPYYHVTFTYDVVGNPLSIADQVRAPGHRVYDRSFSYDARYQVTGFAGTIDGGPVARNYAYDLTGNMIANDGLAGGPLAMEPGSNRLSGTLASGLVTPLFNYDAAGRMVTSPGRSMSYDARGRLVRIELADGTRVDYVYGAEGERVAKRVTRNGVTEETLYLDDLYEETGAVMRRHVHDADRRLATVLSTGGTLFHHYHAHGNVVLLTDSAGTIAQHTGYLPFGEVAFSDGAGPGDIGFLGRPFDAETGLVFAHARYYDPQLGRFLTPDRFALANPDRMLPTPLQLNTYLYAGNNPLRYRDDDGAWWKWLVGALVIAALVVATIVVGVVTGGAGFAFGILLAASIGSAFGSGIGVYAAATSGGDLADGFLFGALVGGAAGAAGYAAGAAVGLAGIGGTWGSILAGAAQGAVVGAGSGAIAGYAGGTGSVGDIFAQAGIGFLIGAAVGGVIGYATANPGEVGQSVQDAFSTGSVDVPAPTGYGVETHYYTTGSGWQQLGQAANQHVTSLLQSAATPVGVNLGITTATGVAGFAHAAAYHDWDEIRAWLIDSFGGEDEEVIVEVPVGGVI